MRGAWAIAALLGLVTAAVGQSPLDDPLARIQSEAAATRGEARLRAYHFGAQGAGGVFSTHTGHSNRLVPAYFLGSTIDLTPFIGANSAYRDPERVRAIYGRVPENTVHPEAGYLDQSDLYRIQAEAVRRGARHLFTVWFDGMDWQVVRAAVLARTGREPSEGPGAGPFFENFAGTQVQFAAVVTSPSHADPPDEAYDVDQQTLGDFSGLLGGGYDPRFGGLTPWEVGPLLTQAPHYLMGQSAGAEGKRQVESAGGTVHAYTDSAPSAGAYATGVKQTNNLINVDNKGRVVETLYNQLQAQGWRVGTVTSVPFCHASPAAMYAHNVSRDDYQDLAREMLGLPSIVQETGRGPARAGLDVVIGAGWGISARERDRGTQGANLAPGGLYLAEADRAAIDVRNGGNYVVAERTPGRRGSELLDDAAVEAARRGASLFGYFGVASGHLPYQTANGDYRPVKGVRGVAERYSPTDLRENPTLADMTRAALTVMGAEPRRPFALFIEPGDVDFALHDNNLDNAVGAMVSGEEALRVILDWVERNSNWEESILIVTSDHGHYLVIDDPAALAGSARAPDLGSRDRP